MAKESKSTSSRESQEIRFTMEVKASLSKGDIDKIDFKMDLNPKERIIAIDQHLSSYNELAVIFKEIQKVLGQINDKTIAYNDATRVVDPEERFNKDYEENFKPSFGKIGKIHYKHESPGVSNVSYTRSYNGDMKPPLK
ncbi:MAG TPA: hypothetical protein VK666_19555 [Chryseolinea sp.]|nr:hypothetical protein [Chryseolinea sp.]